MSKIKNGLDQYGTEPFEQQLFGTAGIEGVKLNAVKFAPVIVSCILYLLSLVLQSTEIVTSALCGSQEP